MEIELVEFYPIEIKKNSFLIGTLHIYIIDYQMDVRGIDVFKKKDRYFFSIPYKKSLDPESKQVVRFPIISFSDIAKQKEMMEKIIKLGVPYITKYLKNNEKNHGSST